MSGAFRSNKNRKMRQSFHDAVVVYERRLMAFPSIICETATETTPKKVISLPMFMQNYSVAVVTAGCKV